MTDCGSAAHWPLGGEGDAEGISGPNVNPIHSYAFKIKEIFSEEYKCN